MWGEGGSLRNDTTMKADQETSYFFEGRSATILVRGKKKSKFRKEKNPNVTAVYYSTECLWAPSLRTLLVATGDGHTQKETQRTHFIPVKVLTLGELSTPDFLKGFSILGERPHRGVSLREERLP